MTSRSGSTHRPRSERLSGISACKEGSPRLSYAERAGLNRTYLSDLERGKETEQVRRILRVLKELGVRMTLERADW